MPCVVDYRAEAIINYLSDSISFKISETVKMYASSAMPAQKEDLQKNV